MSIKSYNWLLLRGLATEKRQWGKFPETLKDEVEDKDVLMIDLPGAGDHFLETSPLSIDQYVYFLRDKFKEQKQDGPYALMAISMGAMIAMRWQELFPDDFEKLVLMNTSASDVVPIYKRVRPQGMLFFLDVFRRPSIEEQIETILNFTTNILENKKEVAHEFAKHYTEKPISKQNQIRQLYAASRFKSPKKLAKDALFLIGEGDRLVNPVSTKALRRKYNAELFAHDKAGHDLTLDAGQWVIESVKKWLTN